MIDVTSVSLGRMEGTAGPFSNMLTTNSQTEEASDPTVISSLVSSATMQNDVDAEFSEQAENSFSVTLGLLWQKEKP